MSMFRYNFKMCDEYVDSPTYSIVPRMCIGSYDRMDEDTFDSDLGLATGHFTVKQPKIRVIGYKPENETICHHLWMKYKPIYEEMILSNMLKDPHLTLVNIYTKDKFLIAEFLDERKDDRQVLKDSYAFYGKINVEVTYENRPQKLCKFKSSENWIDIIEMDGDSYKDTMLDFDQRIIEIQEYHP